MAAMTVLFVVTVCFTLGAGLAATDHTIRLAILRRYQAIIIHSKGLLPSLACRLCELVGAHDEFLNDCHEYFAASKERLGSHLNEIKRLEREVDILLQKNTANQAARISHIATINDLSARLVESRRTNDRLQIEKSGLRTQIEVDGKETTQLCGLVREFECEKTDCGLELEEAREEIKSLRRSRGELQRSFRRLYEGLGEADEPRYGV